MLFASSPLSERAKEGQDQQGRGGSQEVLLSFD